MPTWHSNIRTCQSAVSLRQPASVSVTQGQTAELDCIIDSDNGLIISWYKQIPGEAPQFILSAYPARCMPHQYGTGFSSPRFTFKAKGLRNHQLLIRDVEASDSAIYYCARCVHPDSVTLFGTGTQLMVAGPQQPTLLIFQPSAEEMTTRGTATLLCVVSDLSTPFAPVSWTAEGCSPSLMGRSSAPFRQPDGTFAMSSSLTVPAAHWREGCVFACTVQQGERRVQVRLRRSECWVSVQKEK
uniref:Ig-like domain-containing protein n=1 Tax=Erpetoichthys calabaricus TaxID=27687 RepID=A0A8C4TNM1_ERPCA